MRFSELVKLLERNGFRLVREKGSIRYNGTSLARRLTPHYGRAIIPSRESRN